MQTPHCLTPKETLQTARAMLRSGGILLDVRSVEEYQQFHFKGSVFIPIPLPPFGAETVCYVASRIATLIQNIGTECPIVVFCKKGKRSGLARAILENYGVDNILDLGGVKDEPLKSLIQTGGQL